HPSRPDVHWLSLHDALPISRPARAGVRSIGTIFFTQPAYRGKLGNYESVKRNDPCRPEDLHEGKRKRAHWSNPCTSRRHPGRRRSEEHTSELQSRLDLVCRL